MSPMADHAARPKLGRWQTAALVTAATLPALILITIGAAGSYDNLRQLEAAKHVPLPWLQPAGLDGGLVGIVALDLTLTWAGYPIWWLRWTARLFALGTVAANAAAGWPDPASMALRMACPVLIVIVSEAVRAVLLHRHHATASDRIPGSRWLLAPRSTFVLWRRMRLWNITSYPAAVDMEIARRHAIEQLAEHYGTQGWRGKAPGSLVWMLDTGVRMDDALAAVAAITAPAPEPEPAGGTTARRRGDTAGRKPPRHKTGTTAARVSVPADVDTQAEALQILAAEPDITGSELGRRLGKTPGYGRALMRKLNGAPSTGEQPRV